MPLQRAPNFSRNWQYLKNIMSAYPAFETKSDTPSLSDHLHAKAMTEFLTRATLATLPLNKATVAEVLAGTLQWPTSTNVSQFKGSTVPLSFLEENGFVTFYAGWLNVRCRTPNNLDSVDPSLLPLIGAVKHLKDICYGWNDCIQPHYSCPAKSFEESLSTQFDKVSVSEFLQGLRLEDGHYHLPPGNQNFSPLVSTYLWRAFNEKEPAQSFENWITCLRVNCEWAMPVLFEHNEVGERENFNEQLIAWISKDGALEGPVTTLQKQSLNEHAFSSIVSPVSTQIHIDINLNGGNRLSPPKTIELKKPTLDTLSSAYPLLRVDGLSDLQRVRLLSRHHLHDPDIFYTPLVAAAAEASIRIDGQMLVSSGFVEALLEQAECKPLLKHILFNALPRYQCAGYKLFFLSEHATCNVALFYLTQRLSFQRNRSDSPAMLSIENGFLHMVRDEYLRTIESMQDVGEFLLEVVEFLSDAINLRAVDFSQSSEYRILIDILDSLNHNHVVQLAKSFELLTFNGSEGKSRQAKDHYCYLLGFWLIDRFDETGIDSTGSLSQCIKTALFNRYEAEFKDNVSGGCQTLEPSAFFSALPWHKLSQTDNGGRLLALSNYSNKWNLNSESEGKNPIPIASAIRQYLQVLMCIGIPHRIDKEWERFACRVVEVVRIFGFGDETHVFYLFDPFFDVSGYDIWKSFCSYSNVLPEPLYLDFFDRCSAFIPLNQLFALLERTTIDGRSRKLQDQIVVRQSAETEDMGLAGLEQAFISACESEHMALAEKLLHAAKDILTQRFGMSTHSQIAERRKLWLTYEYKWTLVSEAAKLQSDADAFAQFARNLAIPFAQSSSQFAMDDGRYWRVCDFFRRYITAGAYLKADPEKSVVFMEALYRESKEQIHGFMLFAAQAAVFEKSKNLSGLRRALSRFIDAVGDVEPDRMPNQWVAAILDAYKNCKDGPSIDSFWERLSIDQKNRAKVLYPYCKSLIDRGDRLIAKQVLNRFRDHNQVMPDDLRIDELVNELAKALPDELDMRGFIRDMNEQSQRSKVQLAKHYREIIGSEFSDYVDIVARGKSVEEYLSDIVLEVARELVLRKKNLQLHSGKAGDKQNFRITKEDLINDWFTSLFDKRLADARVGLRDQKRGGESASGDNPGEIDGYITHAKNKRIAIFEAFRLFSLNTTVISEHLNKIWGYDKESLSLVFIAAYCDVNDFGTLVREYTKFVSKTEYTGFKRPLKDEHDLEPLRDTDHIWMGVERRQRGAQEVTFYHLLLRMGNAQLETGT